MKFCRLVVSGSELPHRSSERSSAHEGAGRRYEETASYSSLAKTRHTMTGPTWSIYSDVRCQYDSRMRCPSRSSWLRRSPCGRTLTSLKILRHARLRPPAARHDQGWPQQLWLELAQTKLAASPPTKFADTVTTSLQSSTNRGLETVRTQTESWAGLGTHASANRAKRGHLHSSPTQMSSRSSRGPPLLGPLRLFS